MHFFFLANLLAHHYYSKRKKKKVQSVSAYELRYEGTFLMLENMLAIFSVRLT